MNKYLQIIEESFVGYGNYLWTEVSQPQWNSYFWWLIGLSMLVWGLELAFPWRKGQRAFRRDFWLDAFYMFFNFFLFSLVGYNAISNVAVEAFNDFLALFGIENLVALEIGSWPPWSQFLLLFLLADFIQWNVHRLLHAVPWLWEFHKVHHSVKEMGFAAHLRYHWAETIVYRTIQYLPLAMIGYSIQDFFFVHLLALTIGHLNHANLNLDYGPLRYILNNPKMHIWHHAKDMPAEHAYGVNFGISLSIWDYIFRTAYIPKTGRDITLGYEDDEKMPDGFWGQVVRPFKAIFSRQ